MSLVTQIYFTKIYFLSQRKEKNEIGGLKQWPKPAFLQVHSGFSPIVLGEWVTAAYDPVFFTVSCAHL